MVKKILGLALCLAFIFSTLPVMISTAAVLAADPSTTTSITVTKYAADGVTVLDQEVLDLAALQAMTVQGDGVTHYFMQGPTFDPANLWDPAETVNLKDKGAIKGTDVKDICDLVGGAGSSDLIQIKAVDGYNERFTYDDVYNPEPAQGKFIICWYTKNAGDESPQLYPDGAYVPEYADGMQLVFMPETTNADGKYVFGHDDMRNTLPASNQHYYWQDSVQYPSANGLSIKYISEVSIYTNPAALWNLELDGASNYIMEQGEFENGVACTAGGHGVTWTDGSGNVYGGLPLWMLCGWVDDGIVHGAGSFNDALAAAGYDIKVTDISGSYSYTFTSDSVARNNGIIVANTMNGAPLPDDKYPLRLVGSALTSGSQKVSQIAKIELLNIPDIDTWTLALDGADDYNMAQAEFESGVNCLTDNHAKTYIDGSGTWKGLPLWLLCGWVDDDIQHGSGAFNDDVAAAGYDVKVTSSDGSSYTFDSAFVARNDNIIVANTLDGVELPDAAYPLALVGSDISSAQNLVKITKIELLGLQYALTVNISGSGTVDKVPDLASYELGTVVQLAAHPADGWNFSGWSGSLTGSTNPADVTMNGNKTITATFTLATWTLQLNGMTKLAVSQADFEAVAAANPLSWTDGSGNVYSGFALWRLVGKVDDGDTATMNNDYAARNYTINIMAPDGYSKNFLSSAVLNNDNMIIANQMNGAPLPKTGSKPPYPLKLVGPGLSSGQMVSKIVTISFAIPWDIQLIGASTVTQTNTQFETLAAANPASWTDGSGNIWSGTALWRLVALVDDADPATFNDAFAAAGYSIKITASDGFSKTFASADIARNETRIIANQVNAYWLLPDKFPLRFVGTGLTSGQMVSKIIKIELLNLPKVVTAGAGPNGSINPAGDVAVAYGTNKLFSITPDVGYHVADVIVDGSSIGPLTKYTFSSVIANHTISATFAHGGTWYLENDLTLENTPGTQSSLVNLPDGATSIWRSNLPADYDISFSPGDWSASLQTPDWGTGGCTVQVGVYSGGGFIPFPSSGVPAFSPYASCIIVTIPTSSSETILIGDFLAISITNNSGSDQDIVTDGSSFLSLPESDPGFPVPELASGILLGFGIAGLIVFVFIRQNKTSKNGTIQG
jgi:hypothetical protein